MGKRGIARDDGLRPEKIKMRRTNEMKGTAQGSQEVARVIKKLKRLD